MDWTIYLILFGAGAGAGIMNTVGGGGSVLTLPAMIFAGIPPTEANATNRIGIIAQGAMALWRFRLGGVQEDATSLRLVAAGLPGAAIGALLAAWIPDEHFRVLLGYLMLGLLALIMLRPKPRLPEVGVMDSAWSLLSGRGKLATAVSFFLLGIYMGFLQAGGGIMILIVLGYLMRMDLVRGNYVKLFFVFFLQLMAVGVFIASGVAIYWVAGLALFAGQTGGAWIGSLIALKGGEKWITAVLVVSILASSGRLIGLY